MPQKKTEREKNVFETLRRVFFVRYEHNLTLLLLTYIHIERIDGSEQNKTKILFNVVQFIKIDFFLQKMSDCEEKHHPVQAYFEYCADSNTSNCQLCKKIYKGRHSGNLLNHLKRKHHALYALILPKCNKYTKPKEENKATINVKYNIEDLKKAFVAWVTVDARPFSLFRDVGAKGVLDPIFDACKKADIDFCVNNQNVKDFCLDYEKRIEYEIIEQVQGKFISVIMDIVDIQDR